MLLVKIKLKINDKITILPSLITLKLPSYLHKIKLKRKKNFLPHSHSPPSNVPPPSISLHLQTLLLHQHSGWHPLAFLLSFSSSWSLFLHTRHTSLSISLLSFVIIVCSYNCQLHINWKKKEWFWNCYWFRWFMWWLLGWRY